MEIDKLLLLRGKDYPLTKNIKARHPTLSEIMDYEGGYNYFMAMVNNLVMTPADIADVLWVEQKVLYTNFKNEWDFFIERSYISGEDIEVSEILNEEKFSIKTRAADKITEECLNYFFNQKGHYVFIVKPKETITLKKDQSIIEDKNTEANKEQQDQDIILYNVSEDNIISEDCFKFTEFLYHIFVQYLNTILWNSTTPLFMRELKSKNPDKPVKIANDILLKALLEDAYEKRNSKKKSYITMDSIVSAIMAENSCYKDIWDYPIYAVNDQYHRLEKIKAYNQTMDTLNSGYYDIKKHPINWEKVDWASVISIN